MPVLFPFDIVPSLVALVPVLLFVPPFLPVGLQCRLQIALVPSILAPKLLVAELKLLLLGLNLIVLVPVLQVP